MIKLKPIINKAINESLNIFTLTIFTGWIPYVTPWYAEMVEYCIKNDESPLFKPHPTDQSKFIMCNNNGMLFEMQCPVGTLFGGFQLLDLIIMELKSHMTCCNSMPLIG